MKCDRHRIGFEGEPGVTGSQFGSDKLLFLFSLLFDWQWRYYYQVQAVCFRSPVPQWGGELTRRQCRFIAHSELIWLSPLSLPPFPVIASSSSDSPSWETSWKFPCKCALPSLLFVARSDSWIIRISWSRSVSDLIFLCSFSSWISLGCSRRVRLRHLGRLYYYRRDSNSLGC